MKTNIFFEKTWAILRPCYTPDNQIQTVGIVGTGFFVSSTKFISAHHSVNSDTFSPNEQYNNNNILLLSSSGEIINITEDCIECRPELDITFIRVPKGDYPYFRNTNKVSVGDVVYSAGYPTSQVVKLLRINPLQIRGIHIFLGKISSIIEPYSIIANDVSIPSLPTAYLVDYSLETGFSGGPLLAGNKVVGMMSHISPETGTVVVIPSRHFYG